MLILYRIVITITLQAPLQTSLLNMQLKGGLAMRYTMFAITLN